MPAVDSPLSVCFIREAYQPAAKIVIPRKDPVEERRFQRRREDFACVHCTHPVSGDGYTNHCPSCLTSLHVDINPGDRAAGCDWPMAPVRVRREGKRGFVILHRCEGCGHEKWNRAASDDDPEELARLLS